MKISACIIFFVTLRTMAAAQPGNPQSSQPVPISGVEALIAGGMTLGARQLLKQRAKK